MSVAAVSRVKDETAAANGWPLVRLGDVCEINPRRPRIDRSDDAPTTFVPMSAVAENGKGIVAAETRPFASVRKGYTYFADGDVIFAKITPCMQNGKHAIVTNTIDGIGFGSTEFHVIRPGSQIAAEWIHYFLLQPEVLNDAEAHFFGAVGQQRVPDSFLHELTIPLPPLDEQRRIAARLNEQMAHVARARAAAEERLRLAQQVETACVRSAFHSESAIEWPLVRLGDVCEAIRGVTFRSDEATHEARSDSIACLATAGVQKEVAWESRRFIPKCRVAPIQILQSGDLLVSTANSKELVGKSCLVGEPPFECTFGAFVTVLRTTAALDSAYLSLWMRSPRMQAFCYRESSNTTGISNLRVNTLLDSQIPLPPLDEQRRIVARLNEQVAHSRRIRTIAQSELAKIDVLPAALLREAFGASRLNG